MNASIVIPLFNRWDLTAQCCQSLLFNTPDDTEFYLIDNGSTDETAQVKVDVRNETNQGFAKACNQGAALVSTEITVFLNNDTIVHSGWLEALIEQFRDDDVGIVGGLLVYPDGGVQHAGVTVDFSRAFADEARNITRDLCVGTYEVQAVTGACLAIRTGLFHDLGGFDECYWNGYEDVDLCLKAKSEGWKIMFTPDCVVTHLESQSGPERWAAVRSNVQRLRDRWEPRD